LLHRHWRYRRHWFDAIDLDLLQLLDERQHGVELIPEMLDFILGHGDAGEMSNAADGIGVDGHGSSGSRFVPAYSRAAFKTTAGSCSVLWRNPIKRGLRFGDKSLYQLARRHFAAEGRGLARQHRREVAGPLCQRLCMQWSESTARERKLRD